MSPWIIRHVTSANLVAAQLRACPSFRTIRLWLQTCGGNRGLNRKSCPGPVRIFRPPTPCPVRKAFQTCNTRVTGTAVAALCCLTILTSMTPQKIWVSVHAAFPQPPPGSPEGPPIGRPMWPGCLLPGGPARDPFTPGPI